MLHTLNEKSLLEAAHVLAQSNQGFAEILKVHGPPPLWAREPGFETLFRIILEQQVSLASADAMYRRLKDNIESLSPSTILTAGSKYLRSLGVTRQKAAYFINVAKAIEDGELELDRLGRESDQVVLQKLTSIKGIGPWTARIYLLMALCRPDIWPIGDVALATAFKNLYGCTKRPTQAALDDMAKAWSPHRATAARLLWHYYLNENINRKQIT